jgi:hypothetical protein
MRRGLRPFGRPGPELRVCVPARSLPFETLKNVFKMKFAHTCFELIGMADLLAVIAACSAHGQQTKTTYTFTSFASDWGSGSSGRTGSVAGFAYPCQLATDNSGNLQVADVKSHTIRKMEPAGINWVVTTAAGLAGSPGSADGTGSAARFVSPLS